MWLQFVRVQFFLFFSLVFFRVCFNSFSLSLSRSLLSVSVHFLHKQKNLSPLSIRKPRAFFSLQWRIKLTAVLLSKKNIPLFIYPRLIFFYTLSSSTCHSFLFIKNTLYVCTHNALISVDVLHFSFNECVENFVVALLLELLLMLALFTVRFLLCPCVRLSI